MVFLRLLSFFEFYKRKLGDFFRQLLVMSRAETNIGVIYNLVCVKKLSQFLF